MIEELAHIWPRGGLFAFSGADGPAEEERRLCLRGTAAGVGWTAPAPFDVTFAAKLGSERLQAEGHPEDVCLPDCWRFFARAADYQGLVEGAFLDQATFALQLTAEGVPMRRSPVLEASREGKQIGECTVFEAEGHWLALCCREQQDARRFALHLGFNSAEEAAEMALQACAADMSLVVVARLRSYLEASVPEALAGTVRRAYFKSFGVQRASLERSDGHLEGCQSISSDKRLAHLWPYDSVFQSLALQPSRADLAEALLLTALGTQAEVQEERAAPPLLAWAVWRQFEQSCRDDLLRKAYPLLLRYIDWFDRHRKRANGLYGWDFAADGTDPAMRGGESGMSGSPRFDEAVSVTAVDLCSYIAAEFLCLEKIARQLEKDVEAAEWKNRRIQLAKLMNELLWDDADRFYYDLDEYGEIIAVKTTTGFLPLLGLVPDRDQAESMRGHIMNPMAFNTPMPLPTVAIDELAFTRRSWRGAVAPEASLLIYFGLMSYGFFSEAREIAHRTLDEIARCYVLYGCVYECYDPMKEHAPHELPQYCTVGAAPNHQAAQCHADFPRTAAAFVHLVQEML